MKSSEEMMTPAIEGEERAQAEKILAGKSMTLSSLGELTPKLKASSYNENQGTVIFSPDGETVYATPASNETLEILRSTGYFKDESAGVPNLNNRETWKGKESSLAEWEALQK